MSSDPKENSRSGGVEVVADQGDDGSYEIRLEKTGEVDVRAVESPTQGNGAGESWKAAAGTDVGTGHVRSKVIFVAVAAVALLLLVMGLLALMRGPRQLSNGKPQTIEVSKSPKFRGYTIEREAPEPAVNLRLDEEPLPVAKEPDEEPEEQPGPTRVEWQSNGGDVERLDALRRVRERLDKTHQEREPEMLIPPDAVDEGPYDPDDDYEDDDEIYDEDVEHYDDEDPDLYDDYE